MLFIAMVMICNPLKLLKLDQETDYTCKYFQRIPIAEIAHSS